MGITKITTSFNTKKEDVIAKKEVKARTADYYFKWESIIKQAKFKRDAFLEIYIK